MASVDKKRVFISYARSDGSYWADKVETLLTANKISSWRDITEMTGEHDNWSEVKKAIDDAHHLVLILTEQALKSQWVKRVCKTRKPSLGTQFVDIWVAPDSWQKSHE